jgi:hypothetical protein
VYGRFDGFSIGTSFFCSVFLYTCLISLNEQIRQITDHLLNFLIFDISGVIYCCFCYFILMFTSFSCKCYFT